MWTGGPLVLVSLEAFNVHIRVGLTPLAVRSGCWGFIRMLVSSAEDAAGHFANRTIINPDVKGNSDVF